MKAINLRIVARSSFALLLFANNVLGLTVVVGQKVSPACAWDPSSGPPITNFLWTIPAYAVSNFYVAPDLSTGMVIEPFPLTNSSPEYYWVDGGNKKISCDITSMGQKLHADAHLGVIAPTIDFIGSIDNKVAYDSNYIGSKNGSKCLHFGGSVSNGVTINGINCTSTNVNMNGIQDITSSGFDVVQTISYHTITLTKIDGSTTTTNYAGLDNLYPTQSMGDGDGVVFSDSPGIGYSSDSLTNAVKFSSDESFRTVLMFQSFAGIRVPVKEIIWNWSGTVSLTNGDWVLISSNAAITVNNHVTMTFPSWTKLVLNK